MLWFYWRRARFGVLVAGVALGSIVTLVVVAGGFDPAATGTSVGKTVATRSGAQLRRAVPLPANLGSLNRGRVLMDDAVGACRTVSYTGVQMIAWWGRGDSTAYLIGVWHSAGEPEVVAGFDGIDEDRPAGSIARPGTAAADHATAGVLSVSSLMLNLLRANYQIEYTGAGIADGRSARIVTVRRRDDTLAARYWLDRATGLPLRREMFDEDGHLVNEGTFIELSIGDTAVRPVSSRVAEDWSARPAKPDLLRLHSQGWPVRAMLAGNLALIGVSRAWTRSGTVVDASYSDGLSVVSVFMQRGELAGALPGWRGTQISGRRVYASEPDQRSLAWSADGVVYTVISDAPERTVSMIVTELPHDGGTGLLQRVDRGLKRIGSWFDPFG